MKYIIPQSDAEAINEMFPDRFKFTGEDYLHSPFDRKFYDFDFQAIFQDIFGMRYEDYLIDKEVTEKGYAIYNYISNPTTPNHVCPKDQPFDSIGLKSKPHYIHGRLSSVDWYGKDSEGEYTVLCVREDYTYEAYFADYVKTITNKITWYYDDVTPGDSSYDKTELELGDASMLGKDTRIRVIEDLKPGVIGLLIQSGLDQNTASSMGFQIFGLYGVEVNAFIEGFKGSLIDAITNDTGISWLDDDIGGVTPRQYILSKIDFTL